MTHTTASLDTINASLEHLKTTALTVPPLTALAWEINDAHQEVQDHAKGMLLAAKRAGEKLLEAKEEGKRTGEIPHGQFQAWIEAHCRCSYTSALRYMQVAKRFQKHPAGCFSDLADVSIRQFLDIKDKPKPTPATQPFTQADAEYAQKLHAMSTRGTEHEAAVAQTKLDTFAKQFGMTGEQVVEKAEQVNPTPEPTTPHERGMNALINELERKFSKFTRKQLLAVIADLITKLGETK
ncbi:DUF3102 domain-containing protein [Roseospira goensis]|uniref:DUF3102 domain-containing protein n=1 Tax=Roseospira goensis TaxID=391922 RepID=A0A7W6RXG3_9PROT|nr:DUF3102 domain-containing protein [Roseospira goensis]MBB4284530.1 hypothetical protein [Roseospira goensis]